MVDQSLEIILGEIPVSTRLVIGSERMRLIFTNTRLIIDHVGKRGSAAVAGMSILGRLSSVFEDLFKSGGEAMSKRATRKWGPEEILRSHKDNFAIRHDEIVDVTITRTSMLLKMSLLTRDDKFELSTVARFDRTLELLNKTIPEKVHVQTISPHDNPLKKH